MTKNFELVNEGINKWTDTRFVESDPYQNNEKVCEIVLCVDWQNQSCTVETRERTNSTAMREYHKIDEAFRLPEQVDAAQFKKYYDEKIKPFLQKRGVFFETVWNGSNLVGNFTNYDEHTVCDESEIEIQDMCDKAPEHDKIMYFSLPASFDDYKDIIFYAEQAGINFMTCDLDDNGTVQKIMDCLEDDCVYIGTNDRGEEMKGMRESIVENEEG